MALGVLGARSGAAFVAIGVATALGFVGLVLQLAGACLWATSSGEREPAPLPDALMDDYLYPGATVAIALGVLGAIGTYASSALAARGVPAAASGLVWAVLTLYAVIGFALSAANGSGSGYVDLVRALRLTVKAPLQLLTIAVLGAVLLGGAGTCATLLVALAGRTESALFVFLYVGVLGFVASFVLAYGAALTGTLLGVLFHAKPALGE